MEEGRSKEEERAMKNEEQASKKVKKLEQRRKKVKKTSTEGRHACMPQGRGEARRRRHTAFTYAQVHTAPADDLGVKK